MLWFTVEEANVDKDRFKGCFREEECKAFEHWDNRHERPAIGVDLSSEEAHFFARTKESQLQYLTKFVREAYKAAKSCLTDS